MNDKIIKYLTGELGEDERKSLLEEVSSNEALKKEMMSCLLIDSLMHLHPMVKDEAAGRESLKRFMQKCHPRKR